MDHHIKLQQMSNVPDLITNLTYLHSFLFEETEKK